MANCERRWAGTKHVEHMSSARGLPLPAMQFPRGAYPADRAAALSGVPVSTVHWWARHDVLVPAVSARRVKLWSYSDLMGLRIIYWMRQKKEAPDGAAVPRTAMRAVRQALAQLAELDLSLWTEDSGPSLCVDRVGNVVVLADPDPEVPYRQRRLTVDDTDLLLVTNEFKTVGGAAGPDLRSPRVHLRIVPGKLGGSPHVVHTRIESRALSALAASGLPSSKIRELYPEIDAAAVDDALALERQLAGNLGVSRAA